MLTVRMIAMKLREAALRLKAKAMGKEEAISERSALTLKASFEFVSMLVDSIDPKRFEAAFEFGVKTEVVGKNDAANALKTLVITQQGLTIISSVLTEKNLNLLQDHLTSKAVATMNLVADCMDHTEPTDRSELISRLAELRIERLQKYKDAVAAEATAKVERDTADDLYWEMLPRLGSSASQTMLDAAKKKKDSKYEEYLKAQDCRIKVECALAEYDRESEDFQEIQSKRA